MSDDASRGRGEGRDPQAPSGPAPRTADACPGGGYGSPQQPVPACPACHHMQAHGPGCPLTSLSVADADVLGYDAALARVHALLATPQPGGGPPPAPSCPACHHAHRHGPGCELASLPVAEASVLGHQAARDLVRVRAGGTGPPDPPVPGFFRRLLRRLRL